VIETTWGFEQPGELDRMLLLSPHLDDAVISCGALLLAHPGATVVTLFAASPDEYSVPLNEHDTMCGFQPGDDTMAVRRDEDLRAQVAVGATARWLDFHQNSHVARDEPLAVPPGAVDAVVEAIADVAPTGVVAPLGLAHVDHQACHATALEVWTKLRDELPWYWYADVPYAFIPGVLGVRLARLHKAGITASPAALSVSDDFAAKWHAFEQYATQVPVLDPMWRLRERLERAGESYWVFS
jgi:LmbE family N-acetylglucosaminyl deacetylase